MGTPRISHHGKGKWYDLCSAFKRWCHDRDFPDQREVRLAIRERYASNTDMLNTFSYTGAFSVAAALGGAIKTTSVDVAKRSLAKTIEQFSVNHIDYEAQDIKVMDVFHYFKYAQRHALQFDLVVLDPPSFARTKQMTFSTAKDYPKLLKDTIAITAKTASLWLPQIMLASV